MDITTLQNIIRFILGLLLALLPLHIIVAQEAPKTGKKLRIKYIENVNGVEIVKDTTITITGRAMAISSLAGLKVDTAALRKLQTGSFDSYVFDTKPMQVKSKQFRVMRLSEKLTAEEREALLKDLSAQQKDSLLTVWLKSGKVKALTGDSLHAVTLEKTGISPEIRAYTLHRAAPGTVYKFQADTIKVLRFSSTDSVTNILPAKAKRIYIRKNEKHASADSIILHSEGKTSYRIISLDSTGQKTIISVGKAGETQVLPGKAITLVLTKVSVQDLTAEDKSALKKSGVAVESKPKEELELEQVEYYPNPNNGKFNLRFKPESKGTTVVRVLDSKGQEVFVDTVEKLNGEYSRQIDLTPFGKGLYFLQIAQGKRYHTKKILVQ